MDIAQGHAIEARLYAENPEHSFMPAVGTILRWQTPRGASAFEFNTSGIRVDSGVQLGDEVQCARDTQHTGVCASPTLE